MTDVMANVFVDVHLSNAKLTLFCDENCLRIASMVTEYSLRQMLRRVVADGITSSFHNAFSDCRCSRFDIVFHGI